MPHQIETLLEASVFLQREHDSSNNPKCDMLLKQLMMRLCFYGKRIISFTTFANVIKLDMHLRATKQTFIYLLDSYNCGSWNILTVQIYYWLNLYKQNQDNDKIPYFYTLMWFIINRNKTVLFDFLIPTFSMWKEHDSYQHRKWNQ